MPRDSKESWRKGSTIIDLSVDGEFGLVRRGTSYWKTVGKLKMFGLRRRLEDRSGSSEEDEKKESAERLEFSV